MCKLITCPAIVNCVPMVLMNEESHHLIMRKIMRKVTVCVKHQAFVMQVAYLKTPFLQACSSRGRHEHQHGLIQKMIGDLMGCSNFSSLICCRIHGKYPQDLDGFHL